MTDTVGAAPDTRELQRAAQVARRYFLDDCSKVDIAAELGISRFKVARLLELAKGAGLVTITVHDPSGVDEHLSEALRQRLGLVRALVVDDAVDPRSQVGAAAARYLAETVEPGTNVGLAWSRSTQALVAHLTRLPPCSIIQLCGVVSNPTGEEHNVELVRRAAKQAGAHAVTFYAPLVVSDPTAAIALRHQPGISDALERSDILTTAVIAVGLWAPGESTVHDALSAAEQQEFAERGAVAETCGILMGADGELLHDGLQDRVIAATATQLRRTRDVVALATEVERIAAVIALARSGLVTTLITHRAVAQTILAAHSAGPTQEPEETR